MNVIKGKVKSSTFPSSAIQDLLLICLFACCVSFYFHIRN
jgi:hypothetical protein